ncbi:MAG: hypothetical protein RL701_5434, partial [Pseudomonadota bacterium]
KGDSKGSGGEYKLSVRDATKVSANDVAAYCDNDAGYDFTSLLGQSLTAGTYYAVVKGYKAGNAGTFQLNVGGGATAADKVSVPTYSQTLAALNQHAIRVMSVLSCHDDSSHGDLPGGLGDCDYTRTQAKALANATNALGSNLQPLVFDIDGNGDGLSKTVVDGISQLANYLEMNVSVRVVFEPDANPGFGLTIKAVDKPGDGCSGLVGNEHQRCAPGASPRFELNFTNPKNAPVVSNPHDTYGGYNFRAELIGDSAYVVDQVPIYIIPRTVNRDEPVPLVAPTGTYWQNVTAADCSGNLRPDWHDLTWNAAIPNGTSVVFGMCASDRAEDLVNCTAKTIATITGGGSCTNDAGCPGGYCSSEKNCHVITRGSCTSDDECGTGSTCVSSKCTFKGQPVYVGSALGTGNYTANVRMNVVLNANVTANTGPTVHDWSLTYVCNSAL